MELEREKRKMRKIEWHKRAEKLDRDQNGAVAFLCLIAILILLLVAWTMFDAGLAARDKVRAQTTADTAAYSQAAIKARSMNMLAYSNISKRSIWGIHSLYPAYMVATHSWIKSAILGNCNACQSGDAGSLDCQICHVARTERVRWVVNACGQWTPEDVQTGEDEYFPGDIQRGSVCNPDRMETWGLFRSMAGRDHSGEMRINQDGTQILDAGARWDPDNYKYTRSGSDFGARRFLPIGDDRDPGTIFYHYVGKDLLAIDNYQRYIAGLTPWWGWSEQLIRSIRNGATISASWPAPVGRFPNFVYSLRDTLLQFMAAVFPGSYGSGQGHQASLYTDSLPVFPGNVGTMKSHIQSVIGAGPTTSNLIDCAVRSMRQGSWECGDIFRAMGHPFYLEHLINALYFALHSNGLVGTDYFQFPWAWAAKLIIHHNAIANHFHTSGVNFTHNSAGFNMGEDRIAAEPWFLKQPRHAADWQLSTSNLVLSYISRGNQFDDDQDGSRQKFGILEDYRSSDNQTQRGREIQQHFHGGLPQSFAAIQELTYGASGYWSMSRSEIFFNVSDRSKFPPDLWRPSWQPRMRPVSLPGEFQQGQYMISQVFREVMMTIAIGSVLGVANLNDMMQAAIDLLHMERASMAMGPSTVEGIAK